MAVEPVEFVFFDVRDTLGYVDRRGHLVVYKPSTEQLLNTVKSVIGMRMGVITNLPENVASADGVKMLKDVGVLDYLDPKGIVINHDAGVDKPRKQIYEYAAKQVQVPLERCMFVGENLIEVLGAQAAGMRAVLKPFPPGGEFSFKARMADPATGLFSGRLFETILEEDHVLGKRITDCADRLSQQLKTPQKKPPLEALGLLVYLLLHYIDPYHHRKEEEALLPIAVARGLPAEESDFIIREHEQGRLYFHAMDVALRRVKAGDTNALKEMQLLIEAFVALYRSHGPRENDKLFPAIGKYMTDSDDSIAVNLLQKIGPADITPYIALLESLEAELGIKVG